MMIGVVLGCRSGSARLDENPVKIVGKVTNLKSSLFTSTFFSGDNAIVLLVNVSFP